MSATRLLILGVLRQMQPAHGYRIRQRLESWQVDEWANVAFGSIYFALNKMADEGLVESTRSSESDRSTSRVTYSMTVAGENEFQRLLRDQWIDRRPIVEPFRAALAFMNDLPREEMLEMLRHRVERAQADADTLVSMSRSGAVAPRHVGELLLLAAAHARAEAQWADDAIAKVLRGDLP